MAKEVEVCGSCGCDLRRHGHYYACDATMELYCAECWPKQPCHDEHDEECMTLILQTQEHKNDRRKT